VGSSPGRLNGGRQGSSVIQLGVWSRVIFGHNQALAGHVVMAPPTVAWAASYNHAPVSCSTGIETEPPMRVGELSIVLEEEGMVLRQVHVWTLTARRCLALQNWDQTLPRAYQASRECAPNLFRSQSTVSPSHSSSP
jgi:hypothetical protein